MLRVVVKEVGTMPYVNRRRRTVECTRAAIVAIAAKKGCAGCLVFHSWYAFVPHSYSSVCSIGDILEPLGANRAATNISIEYAGIAPC